MQVADATTVDTTRPSTSRTPTRPVVRRAGAPSTSTASLRPWPFVEALLRRDACVKLAPGLPHDLVPDGVEAEWVSDHREVKEAVLWSGRLATTASPRDGDRRRRAGHAHRGGRPAAATTGRSAARRLPLRARRRRDPGRAGHRGRGRRRGSAGRRAHRLRRLRRRRSGRRSPAPTGCSRSCRIREKQLRAALRERGIGRLTIKKRGVSVVPEELRKRLSLRGEAEATLVLTRVAGQRHRAARGPPRRRTSTEPRMSEFPHERPPTADPRPPTPRPTTGAGWPCWSAAAPCS